MASPTMHEAAEEKAAKRYNESLAKRVLRWMRVRLAVCFAFLLLSVVAALSAWPYAAIPCLMAAAASLFLYLAARDHYKEIRSRRWKSVTPRVGAVLREPDVPFGEPIRLVG